MADEIRAPILNLEKAVQQQREDNKRERRYVDYIIMWRMHAIAGGHEEVTYPSQTSSASQIA